MATQPINIQHQVYVRYCRSVHPKPVLEIKHVVFNKKLLDNKVSPAWDTVFNKGRTNLNFPMHLLRIIIKLKPAVNNGTLQAINVVGILFKNPQAKTFNVYIKGYIVAKIAFKYECPIAHLISTQLSQMGSATFLDRSATFSSKGTVLWPHLCHD
ncbi:hypothetical protein BDN67DRAFT_1016246 [Paxillus ammoniavirescens]|nr:hypothetical protein BDN67DRAFT_1016246 [Paxillus ammoniavirescens]